MGIIRGFALAVIPASNPTRFNALPQSHFVRTLILDITSRVKDMTTCPSLLLHSIRRVQHPSGRKSPWFFLPLKLASDVSPMMRWGARLVRSIYPQRIAPRALAYLAPAQLKFGPRVIQGLPICRFNWPFITLHLLVAIFWKSYATILLTPFMHDLFRPLTMLR